MYPVHVHFKLLFFSTIFLKSYTVSVQLKFQGFLKAYTFRCTKKRKKEKKEKKWEVQGSNPGNFRGGARRDSLPLPRSQLSEWGYWMEEFRGTSAGDQTTGGSS